MGKDAQATIEQGVALGSSSVTDSDLSSSSGISSAKPNSNTSPSRGFSFFSKVS